MRLYLKANRIMEAEDKVTAVLSRFRGGTAGAFAQQKLDEIKEQNDTPSWDAFKTECHSCARTSGSVLYGLPLHQKGDINKATW